MVSVYKFIMWKYHVTLRFVGGYMKELGSIARADRERETSTGIQHNNYRQTVAVHCWTEQAT